MRARGPWVIALAALLGAGGALSLIAAGPDERAIVARDLDGERLAEAALPASGRFALAYQHSVLRAPAREAFRVESDGALRLEAITSPHAGVLDYYEREGTRTRRGGWWTLRLARPARFERIALAATAVGRRTLVVGERRLPLFREDGRPVHVRLKVES